MLTMGFTWSATCVLPGALRKVAESSTVNGVPLSLLSALRKNKTAALFLLTLYNMFVNYSLAAQPQDRRIIKSVGKSIFAVCASGTAPFCRSVIFLKRSSAAARAIPLGV